VQTTPLMLVQGAACYDEAGRRMLVIDGSEFYGLRGKVWRGELGGEPRWSVLKTQGDLPGRYGHAIAMDSKRRRVLVLGGSNPFYPVYQSYNDLWELSLAPPPSQSSAEPATLSARPGPIVFAFRGAQPNPARGPLNLSFDLPSAAETRVRLYDIAGRVVADEALGRMGPGSYSRRLSGAARLAPGMYVVRLTHGADEAKRRVVVVR